MSRHRITLNQKPSPVFPFSDPSRCASTPGPGGTALWVPELGSDFGAKGIGCFALCHNTQTTVPFCFPPCFRIFLDIFGRQSVFQHQATDLIQRGLRFLCYEQIGLRLQLLKLFLDDFECGGLQ